MAKVPYMPFYVGDWTIGTRTMTAQEKGVYIDLLAFQWDNLFISSDLKRLSKINDEVSEVWGELSSKFKEIEAGKLQNEKLENVRERHQAFTKKQSENGSKGGRPRTQNKPKTNPEQKPTPNPKESFHYDNESDNENVVENVVEIFNAQCTELSQVTKTTEARKTAIRSRIAENGIDSVVMVIRKVVDSEFLNGINENGWKATFDWLMKPSNFIKVLEGNYDNNERQSSNVKGGSGFVAAAAEHLSANDPDWKNL